MGPRMFIRGIDARAGEWTQGYLELQWGRGCSSAESIGAQGVASTRQYGFNGAADVHPRNRPRPSGVQTSARSLQWGRGCSSAESRKAQWVSTRRRSPGWLQWGRGCSYRGIGDAVCEVSCPVRGFNGAADVHPRNRPGAIRARRAGWKLQWGRGCSSAESRRHSGSSRRPTRFNGAADVHPRKPRTDCASVAFSGLLQWGRGCSSAESTRDAQRSGGIIALQWGRGCSSAESREQPSKQQRDRQASMGPRMFIRGN